MNKPTLTLRLFLSALLMLAGSAFADSSASLASPALKNAVILIIRHAEKPGSGYDLSPAGKARAQAYAGYFQHFTIGGQPVKISCIFAAADSKGSERPRLTLEPTGQALGLAVDSRIKTRNFQELADVLQSESHGQAILIAWHHGEIPALLRALGANPETVLPSAKWPEGVYNWLIELRYDADGRLVETRRINEALMPGDS